MSLWTDVRDAVESVAVVVGNYYLPGSSTLTSKLVSKGSQEQLSSDLGILAQLTSGIYGVAQGNLSNYGKLLGGGEASAGTATGTPDAFSGLKPASPDALSSADAFKGIDAGAKADYSLAGASNAPSGIGLQSQSSGAALQQTAAKPGVWARMGTMLESHPIVAGMAIQGAGAVMAGMGASEQPKFKKKNRTTSASNMSADC